MKAVRIVETEKVEVVDLAKPQCGNDEVLLRLRYVGFCGSDLNTYRGGNPMVKMPVIPGHEIGAVIEEKGKNVPENLHVGDIVTVTPYTNCEHCAACRNKRVNACEHNETLGVQRNGAMCEYIALPWQKVIQTVNMTAKQCALIEPMSVGFHAVNRAQVTDSDVVLVIGCGMIGVGAIVRSALRGATVIACDLDDEKLEGAKVVGAAYTINSATEDVHERLVELTDGLMPDVVIEAVGAPQHTRWQSTKLVLRDVWSASAMPRRMFLSRQNSLCRRNSTSAARAMQNLAISELLPNIWQRLTFRMINLSPR